MQTLEFNAKSVPEATSVAAQKLNVAPDRVRVTVLEETKGLFGKSSLRVRAEVLDEVVEASPAPAEEVAQEPIAAETVAAKPARGGRRRGKKEDEAPAPVAESESEPEAAVVVAEPAPTDTEVVATSEDADAILTVVTELLAAADVEVNARIGEISGKYVNIILDGKDVAFLVGKHGEVLNNLQYLVNIVLGRRLARGVRATLDGNDYRRRREEALTQLATKIAEQVLERGEEAVLDALPAFERRIVHKALGEIEGITTYSEGEEPNRRVVIAPAD